MFQLLLEAGINVSRKDHFGMKASDAFSSTGDVIESNSKKKPPLSASLE